MNALEIVEIPGYPGMFTRRIVVEMWQRAGSPHINDAGRLYAQQLEARLSYESGTGSPADDPRRPDKYPLAHVRFGALDVVNSAQPAMIAAGFEYPYAYEPWHGQLPNIYSYPLVTEIPSSAFTDSTPFGETKSQESEEDDMKAIIRSGQPDSGVIIQPGIPPYSLTAQVYAALCSAYGLTSVELEGWKYDTAIREHWTAFNTAKSLGARSTVDLDPEDVQAIADAVRAGLPKAFTVTAQ